MVGMMQSDALCSVVILLEKFASCRLHGSMFQGPKRNVLCHLVRNDSPGLPLESSTLS